MHIFADRFVSRSDEQQRAVLQISWDIIRDGSQLVAIELANAASHLVPCFFFFVHLVWLVGTPPFRAGRKQASLLSIRLFCSCRFGGVEHGQGESLRQVELGQLLSFQQLI